MARKKKVAKKNRNEAAPDDRGLVGYWFAIVGSDQKVLRLGDVEAMLRHDLYLVRYFDLGEEPEPPHMEVVSTDAFIPRPGSPAWLFFDDEDAMDEWVDEHEAQDDDGAQKEEPAPEAA